MNYRKIGVDTRKMTRCYCALLRTTTRKVGALYDRALGPVGINVAQYSLLKGIERLQPASMTELGRYAELDRSTVSRNVRVLERLGLVETRRGDADSREAVVNLTFHGSKTLDAAGPLWENCQREIETLLGPIRVTALQGILQSI